MQYEMTVLKVGDQVAGRYSGSSGATNYSGVVVEISNAENTEVDDDFARDYPVVVRIHPESYPGTFKFGVYVRVAYSEISEINGVAV